MHKSLYVLAILAFVMALASNSEPSFETFSILIVGGMIVQTLERIAEALEGQREKTLSQEDNS